MTRAFLDQLYRGVSSGFVELRTKTTPPTFLPLPSLDGLEAHLERLATDPTLLPWFGVAVRREPTNGTAENCCAVTALIADIDFKHAEPRAVAATVVAFPYKPSYAIESGGGVHLYWLLDEPLTDMDRAERMVKLWSQSVPMSDKMDLARVLRLPGTLNHKPEYVPPRKTTIAIDRGHLRYRVADLETYALQKAAEHGTPGPDAGGFGPRFELPAAIGEGQRNDTLFRFGCSQRSRYGLNEAEVAGILSVINAYRCSARLGKRELESLAKQVMKYADREDRMIDAKNRGEL